MPVYYNLKGHSKSQAAVTEVLPDVLGYIDPYAVTESIGDNFSLATVNKPLIDVAQIPYSQRRTEHPNDAETPAAREEAMTGRQAVVEDTHEPATRTTGHIAPHTISSAEYIVGQIKQHINELIDLCTITENHTIISVLEVLTEKVLQFLLKKS